MIGIYKITSPSKRVYIGQSINIEKRFNSYKGLHHCKSQTILYNSFLKYGVDNHKFDIICECEINELNDKERYFQDLYSAIGISGMNCKLTKTKDRSGTVGIETKKNMSVAMKKRKLTKEQIDACTKRLIEYNKKRAGRKLSDETKQKLRIANLGTKCEKRQGFNHPHSKTVLCLNTGIFYGSAKLASIAYGISYAIVKNRLSGKYKNNTNLIYV